MLIIGDIDDACKLTTHESPLLIAMDSQSRVVVKREGGKYLLVETTSRKLQFAACRLREEEDFQAAALRCLNEVNTEP